MVFTLDCMRGFSEVRSIRAPQAALNHWRVWPLSLIPLLCSESCDHHPNKLPAPMALSWAPLLRTHRGYSHHPGRIQPASRSQRRCYQETLKNWVNESVWCIPGHMVTILTHSKLIYILNVIPTKTRLGGGHWQADPKILQKSKEQRILQTLEQFHMNDGLKYSGTLKSQWT